MNADELLDLASRFSDAIANGDEDALRAVCEPDTVIWHNTDRSEQTLDQNLRVGRWLRTRVQDLAVTVDQRELFAGGFVQQQRLLGTTATGDPFEVLSCMVVRVSAEGRITRADEYLDSAALSALGI